MSSNEELSVTVIPPLYTRALASFTMYNELCAAHISEDFVPVRMRLQQEWTFDGGFVSQLTIVSLDPLLILY